MGGLTRGDGIMATAVAGSINQAANIAGELASSGLYKLRDKMKLNFFPSDSSTQLGVAIVGGFLLKRFGGPLRAFWRPWVKGNVQGALNKAGWLPNGYTVARKVGLGDYLTAQNMQLGGRQVTYGQLAAPPVMLYGQDYNGLPSYAQ
jgi:hypothetical protein